MRRPGAVVATVLSALVLGALVTALGWRLDGGHLERVETPSMGTRAPVGSLLWVRAVDPTDLRAGDFITFHPPGHPEVTYSHLVLAVNPDGTLSTHGAISGPDPWRLRGSAVVGRVAATWHGVGWLVVAAPVLLAGGLLVAGLVTWVRRSWRLPVAIGGAALVTTLAITVYHPLVRAEPLSFVPATRGGADATYVSTGLLPVRVATWDGSVEQTIGMGEVARLHVANADDHHRFAVVVEPAVPRWFWMVLLGLCFAPALWTLVVGAPRAASGQHSAVTA